MVGIDADRVLFFPYCNCNNNLLSIPIRLEKTPIVFSFLQMKNLLAALLVQFIMLIDSNGLLQISSNIRRRGCNSFISSSKAMMTTKPTATTAAAATTTTTTATTATDSQEFQVLTGVRDIVDRYDTFLLDMWYVQHHHVGGCLFH
jgi:hypothetical protein